MVINETVVEFTQCSFTTLNKTIKFLVLAKETSIELVLLKCHVHCGHSRYTGKRKYNILYNKMKQSSWQISFLSYYMNDTKTIIVAKIPCIFFLFIIPRDYV